MIKLRNMMQRGDLLQPDATVLTSEHGLGLPYNPIFVYELMQPLLALTSSNDSETMKSLSIEC